VDLHQFEDGCLCVLITRPRTPTSPALHECFKPQSMRELYRVEFENCGRKEGDTWSDFVDELMILACKAFPGYRTNPRRHLC